MSTAQVHSATYTPKGEGGEKNTEKGKKNGETKNYSLEKVQKQKTENRSYEEQRKVLEKNI